MKNEKYGNCLFHYNTPDSLFFKSLLQLFHLLNGHEQTATKPILLIHSATALQQTGLVVEVILVIKSLRHLLDQHAVMNNVMPENGVVVFVDTNKFQKLILLGTVDFKQHGKLLQQVIKRIFHSHFSSILNFIASPFCRSRTPSAIFVPFHNSESFPQDAIGQLILSTAPIRSSACNNDPC